MQNNIVEQFKPQIPQSQISKSKTKNKQTIDIIHEVMNG